MSKQIVAVAFIRQRRAAVNTRRGGEVGRCSEADHSPSVQEATRAAQIESALGSDPADVLCRVARVAVGAEALSRQPA